MDDKQSAMLWQLMQSLSTHTQESPTIHQPNFEHTLMSLRPLLQPRQQMILDLMIKIQELQALINEIQQ